LRLSESLCQINLAQSGLNPDLTEEFLQFLLLSEKPIYTKDYGTKIVILVRIGSTDP
jgi:hypothetical protein